MKRIVPILAAALCLVVPSFASSPDFEITPLFGYHLAGSADYSEGSVDVKDSITYGLILSYVEHQKGFSVDFTWSRADGWLYFTATEAGYTDDNFGMSSNYFLLGANKDFGQNRFRFFIGGDIGAAWFDTRTSDVKDAWFFSLDIKTGVKFYINDRLGLRFQGRFLVPMSFSEGGFWFGIGSGGGSSGIYFGGNSVVLQGDFTLGLIIRI